uniref:Uncharacterized protein n=1 Tax=Plectus sambesii TaxID=2011161 RepID=A0A914XJ11_9BILA
MFGCMRNHYRYSSVRDPAQRPLPPPSQHPYPLTKGASDSGGIKLLDNWISYLFNEGSGTSYVPVVCKRREIQTVASATELAQSARLVIAGDVIRSCGARFGED